jgi:hypothetical protein
MDQSDIEQDLMLDLLQRQSKFDPVRASFDISRARSGRTPRW